MQMKKVYCLIIFSVCCVFANAQLKRLRPNQSSVTNAQLYQIQKGSEISLGFNGIKSLSGNYFIGLGLDLKYAYNFTESLAATASTGYSSVAGVHYFPIKLGARFMMHQIFYIEPQLGEGVAKHNNVAEYNNSNSFFLYAAQMGVIPTKNLDVSLRYEGLTPIGGNGNNDFFNGYNSLYTLSLRVACRLPFDNK
jgi:hypothetical protein